MMMIDAQSADVTAVHPAVPLLPAPHLGSLAVVLVVVAEQMQDAVDQEEPQLRRRILRVVPRRDRGRDHHVAEHPHAVLIGVVLREAQHIGRPGFAHVPEVEVLDLGVLHEADGQLGVLDPLSPQGVARERAQRIDVERA